jgi:hypothetical protein
VKKRPTASGNTATYEQIRAAAEIVKQNSEPIRDALVFVMPEGFLDEGTLLRLERGDDGLWHEVKPRPFYDGPAWNNEAFAIAAPADEEQ